MIFKSTLLTIGNVLDIFKKFLYCTWFLNLIHLRAKRLDGIQNTFHFHGYELALNQTFRQEELHIFILDQENFRKSLEKFVALYSMRSWTRKEYWLLDIAYLTKNVFKEKLFDQIRSALKNLPLDLDDDLFLYSGNLFINN